MEACNALLEAIAAARQVMGQRGSPRAKSDQPSVILMDQDEETLNASEQQPRMHDLLKELEVTRKASRRRLGGLQHEFTQLQQHHTEQEAKLTQLSINLAQVQETNRGLSDKLASSEDEIRRLTAEIALRDSQDAVEELRITRESEAKLKEALRDREAKLAVAEVKMAELQALAFASSGDDRLGMLRQQVHELTTEVVSRDKLLEAKEALLNDVRSRLQIAMDEKYQLNMRLDETDHRAQSAAGQVSALTTAISLKEQLLAECRAGLRQAQSDYTEALVLRDQDEAQALAREDALRQVVSQMQRDCEGLRAELQARDQHIGLLQRSLHESQLQGVQLDQLRIEQAQKYTKAKNVLAQHLRVTATLNRARQAFTVWVRWSLHHRSSRHSSELQSHRDESHGTIQHLSAALSAKAAEANALQDKTAQLNRQLLETRMDMEAENDVLLRKVRDLESKSAHEAASAAARLQATTAELNLVRETIAKLETNKETEGAQASEIIRSKNSQMRELRAQLNDATEQRTVVVERLEAEMRRREAALVEKDAAWRNERAQRLDCEGHLEAALEHQKALKAEVEALTRLCREHESTREARDGNLNSAASVLAEVRAKDTERQIEALRHEIAAEKSRARALEDALQKAHDRSEQLQHELATRPTVTVTEQVTVTAPPAPTTPPIRPTPPPHVATTPAATTAASAEELDALETRALAAESELAESKDLVRRLQGDIASLQRTASRVSDAELQHSELEITVADLAARLEVSEAQRRAEAAALLELASGLESSHTEEVSALLQSVSAAQQRIVAASQESTKEAETKRRKLQKLLRQRANSIVALSRAHSRAGLALRFATWLRFAALHKIRSIRDQSTRAIQRLEGTAERFRAVAEAAVVENRALRNQVDALTVPTVGREERLVQTDADSEIVSLRQQLDAASARSVSAGKVMAAARDQITEIATELKSSKQREQQLVDRVKVLSDALEQEAALARNLKQEFLALLAGGDDAAVAGVHVHHHSVPSRR